MALTPFPRSPAVDRYIHHSLDPNPVSNNMSNTSTVHQESASTNMSMLIRKPMIPIALIAGAFRPQMTACTIAAYGGFNVLRWTSASLIFAYYVFPNRKTYLNTTLTTYEQGLIMNPVAISLMDLITRCDAPAQTLWAGVSFLTVRSLGVKKTAGMQATALGMGLGLFGLATWKISTQTTLEDAAADAFEMVRQDEVALARMESGEK
ncbi:hypothetical protein LTR17_011958 [Elasticomyces elasticus]|nr:hypothetical protein LTR17_011958 [Elasticomyces elasticus]